MSDYAILEAKHYAPYDGCFWQYNYWLLTREKEDAETFNEIQAIFTSEIDSGGWKKETREKAMSPKALIAEAEAWLAGKENREIDWWLGSFAVYDVNDTLDNHIPETYWPRFVQEVPGFIWHCSKCEKPQSSTPDKKGMSYKGNGGVGIEVTDWLCEDCIWLEQIDTALYNINQVAEADEVCATIFEDETLPDDWAMRVFSYGTKNDVLIRKYGDLTIKPEVLRSVLFALDLFDPDRLEG